MKEASVMQSVLAQVFQKLKQYLRVMIGKHLIGMGMKYYSSYYVSSSYVSSSYYADGCSHSCYSHLRELIYLA